MIKWLSKQWWCPINIYGPCIGLTMYRCGRHKAELWWAPAWYSVPEHYHPNCDVEFKILYAKERPIYRKSIRVDIDSSKTFYGLMFTNSSPWTYSGLKSFIGVKDFFYHRQAKGDFFVANTPKIRKRWLSVKASIPHGFKPGKSCMIWINKETWNPGTKPTSAATDFVITPEGTKWGQLTAWYFNIT